MSSADITVALTIEDIAAALNLNSNLLKTALSNSGITEAVFVNDTRDHFCCHQDEIQAYQAIYRKYLPILRDGLMKSNDDKHKRTINLMNCMISAMTHEVDHVSISI
jgi:hypothetical protein